MTSAFIGEPRSPRRPLRHPFALGAEVADWTVIGPAVMLKLGQKDRAHYPCRCVCGITKYIQNQTLRNGHSTSCGCQGSLRTGASNRKHGESRSVLYHRWSAMRHRCARPNHPDYPDYGGRGIQVCAEWADYPCFRDWALQNGFEEGLELDRIDNDGPYSPSNCRWISRRQQCQNNRKTRWVTAFGETKALAAWVEDPRCMVTKHALTGRLNRNWEAERAMSTPRLPTGRPARRR